VKRFEAEEIKVKITKSLITVEGKHESEFASRSFYKEYTLVNGVQLDKMECTMTTDGILTITAPIEDEAPAHAVAERRQETEVSQTQQRQSTVVQEKQEVRQHQQEVRQQETITHAQQKQHETQQEATHHQNVTQQEISQHKKVLEHEAVTDETSPKVPQQQGKPHPVAKQPTPPNPASAPEKSKTSPTLPGDEAVMIPISTLASPEPRVVSPSPEEGPNEISQTNDGKTMKVRKRR